FREPMMTLAPSPTNFLDVVRFLVNHIDADETELKKLSRRRRGTAQTVEPGADARGVCSIGRQLREIESKRRVLGGLQRLLVLRDQPMEKTVRDQALAMLLALAAPYRDCADFRDEWCSTHH